MNLPPVPWFWPELFTWCSLAATRFGLSTPSLGQGTLQRCCLAFATAAAPSGRHWRKDSGPEGCGRRRWGRQKVLIPIPELQEGRAGSGMREREAERSGGIAGRLFQGNLPISYKEIRVWRNPVGRIELLVLARVAGATGKLPQESRSKVAPTLRPCQTSQEPLGGLGTDGTDGTDGTRQWGRSTLVPAPRAVAQWEMWKHKWLVPVQATVPWKPSVLGNGSSQG